jgi:hypothetical protein
MQPTRFTLRVLRASAVASLAGLAVLSSCGGDDASTATDAGMDAAMEMDATSGLPDAARDASGNATDAGADASARDGGSDAGAVDAYVAMESGADANVADANDTDAGTDAGNVDADLDAGGGDADANVADGSEDSAIGDADLTDASDAEIAEAGDADLADGSDAAVDIDANGMCPSDGTSCGNCLATMCCAQVGACLSDPACAASLQCILTCTKAGGQPTQCFQQCGGNPATINAAICAANSCGNGVCL